MNTQSEFQLLKEKYQQLELELAEQKKQNSLLTKVNVKLIVERNEGRLTNTTLEVKEGKIPEYWTNLLHNIYETSKEAILIFNHTENKVISVNDRAIELFEAESDDQFHSVFIRELQYNPVSEQELINLYYEISTTGKASRLFQYPLMP